MTVKQTKKPAAKSPAAETPAVATPPVAPAAPAPLDKQAFQMVLNIIDASDIKGSDAGNIILLKQELARVAGLSAQQPAK